MKDDLMSTTWPDKVRTEWDKYRDFIERLARTELAIVTVPYPDDILRICPRCDGDKDTGRFVHADNCIIVEARQLLGLPTDKRGNLVEEER